MLKRDRSPPNVILIMCDQWRPDCAGFMGHPLVKTPNLDALAAHGVVFENAYCASPVCSPARASWLTGLYPHAHGHHINYGSAYFNGMRGSAMRRDCATLGDCFKSAGYHCGIVGPWHLGHDHEPQHGFEEFWETYNYQGAGRPNRLVDYFNREGVVNPYDRSIPHEKSGMVRRADLLKMDFGVYSDPRQQRSTWTVNRCLDFLDKYADGNDPFFLFASIKDPHPTIVAPPDLLELYPRDEIQLPETWKGGLQGKPGYLAGAKGRLPEDVDEDAFRDMAAHYYALVSHIDREIGRLADNLEKAGRLQNTIIAFISDHGEMLGDHGLVHKRLFYESSAKVPCLISWPNKLPSGLRVKTPMAGVDLAPTLLDLAGVNIPEPIDGRSIAQAIRKGDEPEPQPVFGEISTAEALNRKCDDDANLIGHIMVRDGDWKYIWNRSCRDELYNLADDPLEKYNRAGEPEQASRIRNMRSHIHAMLQRTGPGIMNDFPLADGNQRG